MRYVLYVADVTLLLPSIDSAAGVRRRRPPQGEHCQSEVAKTAESVPAYGVRIVFTCAGTAAYAAFSRKEEFSCDGHMPVAAVRCE